MVRYYKIGNYVLCCKFHNGDILENNRGKMVYVVIITTLF